MRINLLLISIIFGYQLLHAEELDENLSQSLKIEANHNIERLKSFKTEALSNKIFDEEREKGLGEFLEEQEKWDLLRERGLQQYRREKQAGSPQEGSPEYLQYLEEKESQDALYERSRKIHVRTREAVSTQYQDDISQLESDELGLKSGRPRYSLVSRSRNKWVTTGKTAAPGSGSFSNSQPMPNNEFVPAPEFPPAPAPFEGVDDSQFTPPPVFDTPAPYDGSMNNQELNIPPPPPPPPEFDF